MQVELEIANESQDGKNYLTWAPVRGTVRVSQADDDNPVHVTLSNSNTAQGGQLEFALTRGQQRAAELPMSLPADGAPVEFYVAGVVGKPSSADGDAAVAVTREGTSTVLTTKAVMVRIRKNANLLSREEGNRFTTALARLNEQGAGLFKDFREMHRQEIALNQAHGAPGFLSWHRAYLLDLERELQKLDPSVALPYWRFDQPAPNVFSADFMGQSRPGPTGTLAFSPTNLLRQWQTDGGAGIRRVPRFDALTGTAFVSNQATTLTMGGPGAVFDLGVDEFGDDRGGFDSMEGDPHGLAHTSFNGWIRSPGTAPRDPLFFLLHCNVDRLWALWQWFNDRFDGTQPNTFFYRGSVSSNPATVVGHNLLDTMWPWNNVTGGQRPSNAPRTPFPSVATAAAPSPAPTVGDLIDYQGFLDAALDTGFAYDDVPFGIAP
jgi:tyrosinase